AGLYSDLYAFERASGRVRALTHEARLLDPDVSPDGRVIVAVQQKADRRDLVELTPGRPLAIRSLASAPDSQFNAPRWSPDGRRMAVERHVLDAYSEIVVIDAASQALRVVASGPATRWVTPAWRPDGRAIVVAAAREGEPFNLYEVAVD